MTESMSARLDELVGGASEQVDAINAEAHRDELSKLKAIVNVHDRYLATAVSEMARRVDALEAGRTRE